MANTRISARRGQVVNLDAQFFRNGVLTDPWAIRKIEIYQTAIEASNLLTVVPLLNISDSLYPAPVIKTAAGQYYLPFDVPIEYDVPNIFFDLWYFYADPPDGTGGTGSEPTLGPNPTVDCPIVDGPIRRPGYGSDDDWRHRPADDRCRRPSQEFDGPHILKCCHRFWCYPDGWACADDLTTINFGFEPLSIHFNKPEIRPLEIGLMPLPLYDYDYNLVAPIVPFLDAVIIVETRNAELLVNSAPMTIGLRQGSYRANPFVLRYNLNSNSFLIGTYRYRVVITLPDGSTRASKWFIFDIA